MVLVSLIGKTYLLIQVAAIIKNRSSENVSFLAYVFYLISSASWTIFGIFYEDTILTVAGLLGIFAALVLLNIIYLYKEDKSDLL